MSYFLDSLDSKMFFYVNVFCFVTVFLIHTVGSKDRVSCTYKGNLSFCAMIDKIDLFMQLFRNGALKICIVVCVHFNFSAQVFLNICILIYNCVLTIFALCVCVCFFCPAMLSGVTSSEPV